MADVYRRVSCLGGCWSFCLVRFGFCVFFLVVRCFVYVCVSDCVASYFFLCVSDWVASYPFFLCACVSGCVAIYVFVLGCWSVCFCVVSVS